MKRVHLTGIVVNIQGRIIQRCSVCGEKLIDSKNQMSPDRQTIPVYEEQVLVEVDTQGSISQSTVIPKETRSDGSNKIPENFCLDFSDKLEELQ